MNRNPALEGLRGLAALLIVLYHCGVPLVRVGGSFGVDIFFVLSGFLITSLLVGEMGRTGKIDLWRFYVSRILRLYPALLILLVVYVAGARWLWPEGNALLNATLAGLFISDYSTALWMLPIYTRYTWSLSVEWHFYLIWPFVILLLLRGRSWKTQVLTLSSLYVIATLWRSVKSLMTDFWAVYAPLDSRVSGLLLGALTAILLTRRRDDYQQIASAGPWFLVGLVAIIATVPNDAVALQMPMVLVELCTAGLIVSLMLHQGWVYNALAARPVAYTGMISYALYLWHPLIIVALPVHMSWSSKLLIALPLTYAVATASWYLVEAPAMALRHRLKPKQLAPQAT